MWAVYALHDPGGAVRYIGISKDPDDRMIRHIREARSGNTKRKCWIRSILNRGEMFQYSILEWTRDWSEAEKRWVAYFKASGAQLVNGNEGGVTHKGKRIPNPHPTIRRMYRKFEANARSKYTGQRAQERLDMFKKIVEMARKNKTLDQLERRMADRYAD